ncbi:MAG: DNA cytosine methyltransferase [Richelia sp. RM2_1_2]|nr:DNA cytosine methyltransferase [Richelia sp. SM2_1_7]NJM20788.1 DNA cytosine methyltransferase [Richelia sp. SM1_7_0]NJN08937.1 DNA cytosine methyltransferase [Richelia sp. RM1_1_1]NJO28529.1 DNA cytosine methyltransferase [Richelia sp. SL_2_1]NJO57941.1 DNA cytosine methyltransferase [Richelia sp. RM2_1_2]
MQSSIDRKLLNLKAIDIFAGCGGLSLGFQNAGFKIISAFDNWQPAIQVYQKNLFYFLILINLLEINVIDRGISYFPIQ